MKPPVESKGAADFKQNPATQKFLGSFGKSAKFSRVNGKKINAPKKKPYKATQAGLTKEMTANKVL